MLDGLLDELEIPALNAASDTSNTVDVQVHLRALNRVDRIARGYLLAFDRHMNAVLRDVDEVALPGRWV